ncbi:hypothetical protein C5C39_09720 [Rathayibacter sp. AY1F3]|nr:hypothetical protein C5C39_09720 [Rathayibacter sp. AY1F3]
MSVVAGVIFLTGRGLFVSTTFVRMRHALAPTPDGCRWCGVARIGHGHAWVRSVGGHSWEAPTQAQRLARMRERRLTALVA